MKKIYVLTCLLISFHFSYSQTNTFPPSGNVGIGTLTPTSKLSVFEAGGVNTYLTVRNNTISTLFGAGGSTLGLIGTSSSHDFSTYTNNVERMRVTSLGNVGIGTATPFGKLDVNGSILLPGSSLNTMVRPAVGSLRIVGEIAGYSKTALGADDGFLRLSAGAGTNSWTKSFIDLSGYSTQPDLDRNITFGTGGLERMRIASNGNVGIGTTDPKGYKLAVAGNMIAESVKVKLQGTWPDFVFAKDYVLPTLAETEKHINEKGHLPGIPSAAEVDKNGIELGDMNKKLLQKIEELTLYLIEKDKELTKTNDRIDELANQIKVLSQMQTN